MPTGILEFSLLMCVVLAAALLYSAGGHAGASAYLAAFAPFGVTSAIMKPTALVINMQGT